MHRGDADEALDQLHEILDERFEAGPAPYVIERATAEPIGPDEWAVEVVYRPEGAGSPRGVRCAELTAGDGTPRTPVQLAWDIYRRLENGDVAGAADPAGGEVSWSTL